MMVRRPSTFNTFRYLKFNFYVRQSIRSDNINYTSINTINTSTEQAKPDLSMNNVTIEQATPNEIKSEELSMNTSSTEQTNSNSSINSDSSMIIFRFYYYYYYYY